MARRPSQTPTRFEQLRQKRADQSKEQARTPNYDPSNGTLTRFSGYQRQLNNMASLPTVTKARPHIAGRRSKRYIDSLRDHRTPIPTSKRICVLPSIQEDAKINQHTPYRPPHLLPFVPRTVCLVVEQAVPRRKRCSVFGKPTAPPQVQEVLNLTPQTTWESVRFHILTLIFRSFYEGDDLLPNTISLAISPDFEAFEMEVTVGNWLRARNLLGRQGGMLRCRFEVGREKQHYLRAAGRGVLTFLGFPGDAKGVKATGKGQAEQ